MLTSLVPLLSVMLQLRLLSPTIPTGASDVMIFSLKTTAVPSQDIVSAVLIPPPGRPTFAPMSASGTIGVGFRKIKMMRYNMNKDHDYG